MFTNNYANAEELNNNKRIEGDLRDMNNQKVRIPTEKQINYAAVLMSQHVDLTKIPADYQHTFASVFKTIDKYSKVPDPKIYEQTKERYYLIRNTFFKSRISGCSHIVLISQRPSPLPRCSDKTKTSARYANEAKSDTTRAKPTCAGTVSVFRYRPKQRMELSMALRMTTTVLPLPQYDSSEMKRRMREKSNKALSVEMK